MIAQREFCAKFGVDPSDLKALGLEWGELQRIAEDHVRRIGEHEVTAKSLVGHLEKCREVHSLRWRVKNHEHLIDKIIRKTRDDPSRKITLQNYSTEITDLIGIRALHLFKDDWKEIHQQILKMWNLVEGHKPIAYIRKGDEELSYKEVDCVVEEHKRAYRSVHYDIQCQPTKVVTIAEVQVRTLFEEGWSEIDHRIAYPNNTNDPLLTGYLRIFNLLAGASDQMATYIGHLKRGLDKLRDEAQAKDGDAKKAIEALEKIQKELKSEKREKKELEGIVETLKRSTGNSALTFGNMGNILGTTSTASGGTTGFSPTGNLSSTGTGLFGTGGAGSVLYPQHCAVCGATLPAKTGMLSLGTCPICKAPY